MSLYNDWQDLANKERADKEHDQFWGGYFEKEKKFYEYLLDNYETVLKGKVGELAQKLGEELVNFMGFLDGINSSLKTQLDLEALTEETDIALDVDLELLYYNMLNARAEWLYNLPQWDNILTMEKRMEITKDYNRSQIAVSSKVGRNDPCPCGSGKKYKKCCG